MDISRNVDLISYLPEYLRNVRELRATLNAEEEELEKLHRALERTLRNQFIETADECGLSRFEKLLGILPAREETLEGRRARVAARWFDKIPYTLETLKKKLKALCGENGFTIIKNFDDYSLTIRTEPKFLGQEEELEKIAEAVIPCNMAVRLESMAQYRITGKLLNGGKIFDIVKITVSDKD